MEPMFLLVSISSVIIFSPGHGNITIFNDTCSRIDFINFSNNFKEETEMNVSGFSVSLEQGSIGFYVCRNVNITYKRLRMNDAGLVVKANCLKCEYYSKLVKYQEASDALECFYSSKRHIEDNAKFINEEIKYLTVKFHNIPKDHCYETYNSETRESDMKRNTTEFTVICVLALLLLIFMPANLIFWILLCHERSRNRRLTDAVKESISNGSDSPELRARHVDSSLLDSTGGATLADTIDSAS